MNNLEPMMQAAEMHLALENLAENCVTFGNFLADLNEKFKDDEFSDAFCEAKNKGLHVILTRKGIEKIERRLDNLICDEFAHIANSCVSREEYISRILDCVESLVDELEFAHIEFQRKFCRFASDFVLEFGDLEFGKDFEICL